MDSTSATALDRQDMEQLASGQDAALDRLMDRHATGVFRFLFRILGNDGDAHDLAQETFMRVYRQSKTFQTDKPFTNWLYTIASNLARNQLRWRSRHPTVSFDDASDSDPPPVGETLTAIDPEPGQRALAEERIAAVRKAVDLLPDDLRQAVVLCEWQDFKVSDAAAILNTTPKAVESRLYRARKMLREHLRKWL